MSSYHTKWRDVIRTLVVVRDDFKCAVCGKRQMSNHVHHIDGNKFNNLSSNLITLCPSHHLLVGRGKLVLSSKILCMSEPVVFDFDKLFEVIDAMCRVDSK